MSEPDATPMSPETATSGSSAAQPAPGDTSSETPAASADPASGPAGAVPVGQPTAPVPGRSWVRGRSSGPLTRMGPWAPVAGALLGVVVGVVAVLLLAGRADAFRDRLSLVFLVVGMGLLGAAGTLLADEVRMVRWRAREAALRPAAWADTTAGLVNGLTPARLLLVVAGFVLFLAAYVPRR
jgi:hypothetical protein